MIYGSINEMEMIRCMVDEGYDLVIRVNPNPNENLIGRAFLS
jgi:hypothetical protein